MPEAQPVATDLSDDSEAREAVRAWDVALDAMELHLDEIRAGIEGGALPSPYEVPAPAGTLPVTLTPRALRLAAAQRDVEDLLRQRMAVLSSVLSGAAERSGVAPVPVFVDQRG